MSYQYAAMKPEHADQVADLHIEGQPNTLLTRMGKGFLKTMYAEIVSSDWGFGVVALDGNVVIGVGVLSRGTKRLLNDLVRRRWWKLLPPALSTLVRNPGLSLELYRTWRYPKKVEKGIGKGGKEGGEEGATEKPRAHKDAGEFLYLGVRKSHRGQKIASGIFDAAVPACVEKGVMYLLAVVDEKNWRLHQVASHHVARYGWRRIRKIELNDRTMDVIEMDLSRELPEEEWGGGTFDPSMLPESSPESEQAD